MVVKLMFILSIIVNCLSKNIFISGSHTRLTE